VPVTVLGVGSNVRCDGGVKGGDSTDARLYRHCRRGR
jgi:hypothetical protein